MGDEDDYISGAVGNGTNPDDDHSDRSPRDGHGNEPSASDGTVVVSIYTREDCSLCAVAHETVTRVADGLDVPVEIDLVDVDDDPELAAEYGERIPYVLVDGRPAFKYEVDERELRLKLLAAA